MAHKSKRLIRFKEVSRKTGYGHSAIYEKIGKGEFPAPISLGARAVAWVESEVDQWIDDRIAASRGSRSAPADAPPPHEDGFAEPLKADVA
jgi:prophage regulatory protein